ncbi:LysM domain-containing protein [Colletotrichum cereale]|nr:LysM domain-containing protein [Colletotrichum cereale]
MSTTRAFSLVPVLLAYAIGVFSQAVPPPGPTHPGTAPNCNKWHTVTGDDYSCSVLETRYHISHSQFLTWNPAVSNDCLQNFWPDYAYCVSVDASITVTPSKSSTTTFTTRTTRTTSATSTSVPPPISTPYTIEHPVTDLNITTPTLPSEPWPPQKTQPGQPSYCNDWHLVTPGESCESIVSGYNTWMGIEDFLLWNPALGFDCKGLYLYYYVCVGIQRQTQISIDFPTFVPNATVPSMVIPTPVELPPVDNNFEPVPVQGPLPTDCVEYYQARSGETCRHIVATHKSITESQFLAWHPFLNNNCDGLWAGYYYCLWVGNQIPEPPVQTTVPTPVDPDTTSDCRAWFLSDGLTCDDFVLLFGRFSLADFIKWNPQLGLSCENMRPEYWYCVAVPGTPTTRTAPLPSATQPPPDSTSSLPSVPATSTSSGPVATPTPVQPGMISGCLKFYFVQKGDGCWAIANSAGISLDDFYKWNPAVGDCSGLWPEVYVCVGI